MSNLGFELWWARGTTTHLTTQPQVISTPNHVVKVRACKKGERLDSSADFSFLFYLTHQLINLVHFRLGVMCGTCHRQVGGLLVCGERNSLLKQRTPHHFDVGGEDYR
jgi:hypothetical protein